MQWNIYGDAWPVLSIHFSCRELCEWKWIPRMKSIIAPTLANDIDMFPWNDAIDSRPSAGFAHRDDKIGETMRKHNRQCIRRNATVHPVPVIIIIGHSCKPTVFLLFSFCHSFLAWKRFPPFISFVIMTWSLLISNAVLVGEWIRK